MNVVDSSGWLEYFAGGRHARVFEPALEDLESLLVPAVSVYEVFKVLLREAGEEAAIQGVAACSAAASSISQCNELSTPPP